MSFRVQPKYLEQSYIEAKRHFIPLTASLRDKGFKLKKHDLVTLFKSVSKANPDVWVKKNGASGHLKYTNSITRVVVEFQAHSGGSENTVKPHIQEQVLQQVQRHLNIFCNDIFRYERNNWKYEPDFEKIAKDVASAP